MIVGVPKEIKNNEFRVGLTPAGVRELTAHGHNILIQSEAGDGAGFNDRSYTNAGAKIVQSAADVYSLSQMIVKVKEPQPHECELLHPGQILFTFLHLAPDPEQTKCLIESNAIAIAYETVTDNHGGLPLLSPMSEVAGRMSIQAGIHALESSQGGPGILLGGVPGVPPAKVTIIGGGVVGLNAARMALGLGANVTILDRNVTRLRTLDSQYGPNLTTLYSTTESLETEVYSADLVIGAVLIPGDSAPRLVTRKMLKNMRQGAVLVDVAIDQGGCFETSHPTTHQQPTFVIDNIIHYCVANMPGAVARTATFALTNATLPFILKLADQGYRQALLDEPNLRNGLNVYHGAITHPAVAHALGYKYLPAVDALAH
ncbi:alanine dehydrogenase [Acidihalobacter prosperus]